MIQKEKKNNNNFRFNFAFKIEENIWKIYEINFKYLPVYDKGDWHEIVDDEFEFRVEFDKSWSKSSSDISVLTILSKAVIHIVSQNLIV